MSHYDDDDDDVTRRTPKTTDSGSTAAGLGTAIIAILFGIALAFGGWLLFNNKEDTPESVGRDISETVKGAADKAKGAASEVKEAASDAATSGDQPTTGNGSNGQNDSSK